MIESLRKYTGLIIFVIALLFVALAFFGDQASMGRATTTNPVVIIADGTSYTHSQFTKSAEVPGQMANRAYQLMFSGRNDPSAQAEFRTTSELGLLNFVNGLGGGGFGGGDERRFFINRLTLRQARHDFGIHPSDDEIAARIKKAFVDQNGAWDQGAYNKMVERLGQYGMQEKDYLELIGDVLAFEKLGEVLGSGMGGNRDLAAQSSASTEQQVAVQVARTALTTFQEQIKPTDEELKAAWETTKDKYKVERRIKVSYVLAKPTYPEKPKEEAPTIPTGVTEEDKKKEEEAAAKKKADAEAEYQKKKSEEDERVLKAVEALDLAINDSKGKDFDEAVKKQGFEVVSTDFFPRSALPPALTGTTAEGTPTPVGDRLFQLQTSADPLSIFTRALPLKENAYLIARLDGTEDERPKTFEEAKEEARTDYISQKANEALKKDADEKVAKIREGLAAGKPFADLAKEVGLEAKALTPFKNTDNVPGEADTKTIFTTASSVDPGTLADPVIKPDGALFVFVEKRELVKDPARSERINQGVEAQADKLKTAAVQAWFEAKLEATRIEGPLAKP